MNRRIKVILIIALSILTIILSFDLAFPVKIPENYSLLITDINGDPIHAFLNKDDKWKMECSYEELPQDVVRAIIHKEDKYFYWHFGVNPIAIIRAIFQNITSGNIKSGASTITMQVARLIEPRPRTLKSKLIEACRAIQLEMRYSKKEILAIYLNHVPYGGNIEGVKAASLLYFGKMPVAMSLSQIAVLASIPNDPNGLCPGVNDLALYQKRNQLLQRFKKDKLFSDNAIEDALNEPLLASRRAAPANAKHFAWFLKQKYPDSSLLSSSLDLAKQSWLEKKIAQYAPTIRRKGAENISVLIIRNGDRSVVAWQGSVDFQETKYNGQVDGVRAVRSPGSTLKPLIFGMAYDQGLITPKTRMLDVAVSYRGYAPKNYDGKYRGGVSAEEALALSLNVPAVNLLQELGVKAMTDKLTTCEFRSVAKKSQVLGLSLALGGCGCTLYELTGLYGVFANYGNYQPISLLQNAEKQQNDVILSSAAAYVVTESLTKLRRPDLPNGWEYFSNIPKVAWKTGTSYGRRDAWAIGYNPDYTIGIWVGNFAGNTVSELNGAEFAVPLLFELFSSIDPERSGVWFVPPEDIDYRVVCTESGLPPSDFCTSITTDCFKPGISPAGTCQHLIEVFVDTIQNISYCRDCHPEAGYKAKLYHNYPPELTAFFEEEHIVYEKIPPHNPECTRVFCGKEPIISAPEPGEYFLEKGQLLMLTCMAESDVQNVFWFVDDRYYGKCGRQESFFITPPIGNITITVADDKGRKSDLNITVNYY
ncbi:MAG: penicillin-binding protein 1C [Bacteroidales bacterium]|jgi:penicillin-binding protein 1C|nr:penicillin-binding protein 1C [Bacteroidales bacterium]